MKLGTLIRGFFGASSLLVGLAGCAAIYEPADGLPDLGDDPRALPDAAAFKAGKCGTDEMRERVCGSIPEPVDVAADAPFWDCPAEPKQLTSAGPTMLFYTDTKRIDFDKNMTMRYRQELNANCGEAGEIGAEGVNERKGNCCYSRCTPLPVAAKSTRGVPEGWREETSCVDAPQGGTDYPAAGFAECPNAIGFGIGPSPWEADPFDAAATERLRAREAEFFADIPRCCYRVLKPAQ